MTYCLAKALVAERNADTNATPRWAKVLAVVIAAVVLAFVLVWLTGLGGDHGPRRHASSGAAAPGLPHGAR